jgi:SAM-dependent methyltransferase
MRDAVLDFIAYWEEEGARYARHGDYDWMAAQVPGQRALEVGCGVGFGSKALLGRGLAVLALDVLPPCLAAARRRVGASERVHFLEADLADLDAEAHQAILDFKPETVLCWLMGAPQETASEDDKAAGAAVVAYREALHRRVAELAARLPGVEAVHLVDRTAIPWQAKDLGRDTLARYHLAKTFADLPFETTRQDAQYRKLEGGADLAQLRRSHPALKSVTPALASLLARRRKTTQENA